MLRKRNQEWLGIFIGVLGLLFLLVNNGLLWFGWEAVWPAFPLLLGVFLLKIYATRRGPGQLFFGMLVTGLGVFLFLFSTGIFQWGVMRTLWPVFFLITGLSALALAATGGRPLPALVAGLAVVTTGVVGLLATSGRLGSRAIVPLVRLWPVVLVVAGALIYFRARGERLENDELARINRGQPQPDRSGEGANPRRGATKTGVGGPAAGGDPTSAGDGAVPARVDGDGMTDG